MKVSARLSLLLIVCWVLHSQAEEVFPPRFNFDRYSKMVEQSPFALATAVAAPAATPDFAKDLYIANVAHSPEGDMVTLASTSDHNFKKYLTTKEPVDGYNIANIEWSDKVGATKVTISKDGNFATLTFNEALLSQRASNRPPQTQPNPNSPLAAGMQPMPRTVPAGPGLSSSLPTPSSLSLPGRGEITRPHARGVIPRKPSAGRSMKPNLSTAPSQSY